MHTHKSHPVTLTEPQAKQLLTCAQKHPLAGLWVLALGYGLRLGELRALRWRDVDWKHTRLYVRSILPGTWKHEHATEPPFQPTKRASTIDLAPSVLELLQAHRDQQQLRRQRAKARWQDLDLIFCTDLGAPLSTAFLQQELQTLLHQAGLPALPFSVLRQTASYLRFVKNVSLV